MAEKNVNIELSAAWIHSYTRDCAIIIGRGNSIGKFNGWQLNSTLIFTRKIHCVTHESAI